MERLFFAMTEFFSGDPRQIQHFLKVHSLARRIGLGERLDSDTQRVLEIAAIVHDIGIKPAMEKYGSASGKNQEREGPAVARAMLLSLGYERPVIDRVCYLVGRHHTYQNIDGLDCQILIEADFLVNFFENDMQPTAINATLGKVFRTATGKRYCRTMFGLA